MAVWELQFAERQHDEQLRSKRTEEDWADPPDQKDSHSFHNTGDAVSGLCCSLIGQTSDDGGY
ncbi:hypothetical protein JOB18_000996 [Solea senegalensis]|uniref:Uncharacterized protein n=1 Tax=Solea senegalensis TaxID=28829 RepID=A0AAV6S8C0_SOLSE|nr:hypothetical protein JOB18_000996 [Solea senegalensis]